MLVATIPPPPTEALELGPLTIHLYGLAIATGVLVGIWIMRRRWAVMGHDPDLADRAAVVATLAAVVGARVGYILPRLDRFAADPASVVAIWEGGLTFFGALVGGLLGLTWYLRRKQTSLADFLHAAAPAVPVIHAIGRWGNYFNQELYGRPTNLPWALEVEPMHRRPGFEMFSTFHPTFLYELSWNLALAGLLVFLDGRLRLRRGSLFLLYLIGYGIGRFWIELLRIDTAERYLGLSRNNWNALAIIFVGVLALWLWERRKSAPVEEEALDAELVDADPHDPTEPAPPPPPPAADAAESEEAEDRRSH